MDHDLGQSTHQIPSRGCTQCPDKTPVDNVDGLSSQRPCSACASNLDTSATANNRSSAHEDFQVIKNALQYEVDT